MRPDFKPFLSSKLFVALLVMICATPAWADNATFTVGPPNSGYFPYSLSITDANCCLSVVGVILTHGFTVFDLDNTSVIGQPAGWNNIPPIPGFLDSLTWFDFDPAAAIQPSTTLGGFTFESQTAITTLVPGNFDIQLILSNSTVEDIGDATPEPSLTYLLGVILTLLVVGHRRQRRAVGGAA